MNQQKYTDRTKIEQLCENGVQGEDLFFDIYQFLSLYSGLKIANEDLLREQYLVCLEAFKMRYKFLTVGEIWYFVDLGAMGELGKFFTISPKLLSDWAELYRSDDGAKHRNKWTNLYGPKMLDKAPEKEHEPMTPLEATRLSYASWKMLRGGADSIILHGGLVWEYLGKGKELESKDKQREEVLNIFKNRLSKEVTYLK